MKKKLKSRCLKTHNMKFKYLGSIFTSFDKALFFHQIYFRSFVLFVVTYDNRF